MSKIAKFELSQRYKRRKAIKTNKLLLKYNFYTFKVFEQISRGWCDRPIG